VSKSSSSLVAACLLAAALLGAALVDVPSVTLGLKGDEATYVAMTLSITGDHDLKFTQTDLKRFIGLYRMGPEGIFLKQGRRPPAEALEFGKALLHPLIAAPFVAVFGLNGFLILNILLLAGVAWLAIRYARAHGGGGAVIFALAFVFASITPIYAVWLTPEVLNVALVFTAYFLWLYKHAPLAQEHTPPALRWMLSPWTDLAAACLLGAATYSKPPNALLVAPLALDALRRWRIKHTAAVSIVFLVACLGLFGLGLLVTGEWNYQGGNRRTFYGTFPFSDPSVSFSSVGNSMVTNDTDSENVLAPSIMWPMLRRNLVYFVFGRNAGLLPYFFPGLVAILAWLAHSARRDPRRILIALTLLASVLVLLILAPFSWGGGGGPPGNRYFLSLYPVLFFLAPPIGMTTAVSAFLGGALFVAPWLLTPFTNSHFTWTAVDTAALRLLPIELTMVDDLPVRLSSERGRIPFGERPQVLLYFMDNRAWPPEGGRVWIHAGGTAEIIVRADKPLRAVQITWSSPIPNHVSASISGNRAEADLTPPQPVVSRLLTGRGVKYTHNSRGYVLRLSADRGFVPKLIEPSSTDMRFLGASAELKFEQ
jgi:hypothetical protein